MNNCRTFFLSHKPSTIILHATHPKSVYFTNVTRKQNNSSEMKSITQTLPVSSGEIPRTQKLKSFPLWTYSYQRFLFQSWRRSENSFACFSHCQELFCLLIHCQSVPPASPSPKMRDQDGHRIPLADLAYYVPYTHSLKTWRNGYYTASPEPCFAGKPLPTVSSPTGPDVLGVSNMARTEQHLAHWPRSIT